MFFSAVKMSLSKTLNLDLLPVHATEIGKCFLLGDERVGHDAQLLHLSALLLSQVLHGLLRVKAGPGVAVAVDLSLVLPRLQRALERLVAQKKWQKFRHKSCTDFTHRSTLRQAHHVKFFSPYILKEKSASVGT